MENREVRILNLSGNFIKQILYKLFNSPSRFTPADGKVWSYWLNRTFKPGLTGLDSGKKVQGLSPNLKPIIIFLLAIVFIINGCERNPGQSYNKEAKPWVWWIWMGSSVTRQGITEQLEDLQKAGIGGVTVYTLYGETGDEENYLDYLSPEWMEMLKHTIHEAERLDMGVDMLLGEGWPIAGPNVTISEAGKKMYIEKIEIKENANVRDYYRPLNDYYLNNKFNDEKLKDYLDKRKYTSLITLAAYDEEGNYLDISSRVDSAGFIHWGDVQNTWEVYAAFQCPTLRRQLSASRSGEGWAIDYFTDTSIINYLKGFEDAFNRVGIEKGKIRTFLHDSYELYQENWTRDFLSEFRKRRGYDLEPYIRYLADTTKCDIRQRFVTDYCETISDVLHDKFTMSYVNRSHQMGIQTMNQAHNSPGNILDLYALSDMPMTENGSSGFTIPGLRKSADGISMMDGVRNPPLHHKFASSAANVAGRKFTAAEATTVLDYHFKESLSQIKPSVDELFISGINHVFLNNLTYSPKGKPWPGRLIYFPTNYNQQSHFWNELPALTEYISKCQTILQNTIPHNDILLYFPLHDLLREEVNKNRESNSISRKRLSRPEIIYMFLEMLDWHDSGFGKLAHGLFYGGYTFDFVSDRMIANLEVKDSSIITGNTRYKAIVVPDIKTIPLETLKLLKDLNRKGATIIFENDIPSDIPGLFDTENQKKLITSLRDEMLQDNSGIKVTTDLYDVLTKEGIYSEGMTVHGLEFIRKRSGNSIIYFIVNGSDKFSEGWIPLATETKAVEIYDPLNEKRGNAVIRKNATGTDIYLQLQPGQSCILTCTDKKLFRSKWEYLKADETRKQEISGPWLLTPSQGIGGTETPPPDTLQIPESWTVLGDKYESFSGKVIYSNTFEIPDELLSGDDFLLDLGNVRETARVKINGKDIGLAWCIPFHLMVSKDIIKKTNTIEIEVTNLSFNRILKMEREGVKWRNYRRFWLLPGSGFDMSDVKPEDSGLLSPVYLIPMLQNPSGIPAY